MTVGQGDSLAGREWDAVPKPPPAHSARTWQHAPIPVRGRFRRLPAGLVPGILAALVVAGLGAWYIPQQPTRYTADVQLLLAPSVQSNPSATSSYFETLSSGQLPATAAAIIEDRQLLSSATSGMDRDTRRSVKATVTVLPDTAVVDVQVTAPTASAAETAAQSLASAGSAKVSRLLDPYTLTVIGSANGSANRSSLGPGEWIALFAFAALVAGLVVHQFFYRLARRRAIAAWVARVE